MYDSFFYNGNCLGQYSWFHNGKYHGQDVVIHDLKIANGPLVKLHKVCDAYFVNKACASSMRRLSESGNIMR